MSESGTQPDNGGTLADLLAHHVSERPQAPAIASGKVKYSYSELDDAVGNFANHLANRVVPGARVLVQAPSDSAFVVAALSVARVGAVIVPVGSWMRGPDLRRAVEIAAPQVAIVADDHAQQPDLSIPVLRLGTFSLKSASRRPHPIPEAGSPAAVFFTSGTTGATKGVLHSHASLLRTLRALAAAPASATGQQSWLTPIPMDTIGGFSIMCRVLGQGDRLLLQDQFHPRRTLEAIEGERVTCLAVTPAMLSVLLRVPAITDYDLGSLGIVGLGSSRLDPSLARRAADLTKALVVNSYGSTELGGPVLISFGDSPLFDPLPGVEIAVLDTDGRPLPVDEAGQLACRVEEFMIGYLEGAGEVGPACDDSGWYCTGDLALRTADGRVKVLGRLDEMVTRGGRKVYPSEVEDVLLLHEGVKDAVVVGVESPDGYDELCAFVVPVERVALRPEDLTRFCGEHLPTYKRPNRISIEDELPKTANGKLQRFVLANRLKQGS